MSNLVGQATLLYDLDGNLTIHSTWAYSSGVENRLIEVRSTNGLNVVAGAVRVRSVYDYMGRRAAKYAFTNDGTGWIGISTNHFVYDGWNLIQEVTRQASGVSTNFYYWGLDLSGTPQGAGGIGGLLAMETRSASESNTYFFTYDGNGNVAQMIDGTNGAVVAHYEYEPFGNITVMAGPMATNNHFRFSTKYWDEETGLGYWGYRYYSAQSGRWLCRDPIGVHGGENLYALLANKTLSNVDGLGISPCNWSFQEFEWASPEHLKWLQEGHSGLTQGYCHDDGLHFSSPGEPCGKNGGRKLFDYTISDCEALITIVYGHPWPTTDTYVDVLDHELVHFEYYKDYYETMEENIQSVDGGCVCPDCYDATVEWLGAENVAGAAFQDYNNAKFHCQVYQNGEAIPDGDASTDWCLYANDLEMEYLSALIDANGADEKRGQKCAESCD